MKLLIFSMIVIATLAVKFVSAAPARVVPYEGGTAIVGSVKAVPECNKGEAQVWVAQGSVLLYQSAVPIGGSFEFHNKPGLFQVVVTTNSGCYAEEHVDARKGAVKRVDLTMKRRAVKPRGGRG